MNSTLPGHPAAWTGTVADRLRHHLDELGARRLLVVHGYDSYRTSGAEALVCAAGEGRTVVDLPPVRPNPTVGDVITGVAQARRFRPDVVLGIGGGSSLDVAKSVALLTAQPHSADDCLQNPSLVRPQRRSTVVLMPTTAGSGSELTRFATLYRGHHKLSLDTAAMRADLVLADPRLTATLPIGHSVASGLDAFSHAVESYWSRAATPASRSLAWSALQRLVPALTTATRTGSFDDPALRAQMTHGAALAGAAIDLTRTTAAHALSYSLTTHLGLPHGVAVALHLQWLIARHAELDEPSCRHRDGAAAVRQRTRQVEHLIAVHGGASGPAFLGDVLALGRYPTSLAGLSLPASTWIDVWSSALQSDRARNNPAQLTTADLRSSVGMKGGALS